MVIAVNRPEIVDEVARASASYEEALARGDVATLTEAFWPDDRAVRIGDADRQRGYDEIAAYRRGSGRRPVVRSNRDPVITTFGSDLAIVDIVSDYPDDRREGRQSQLWLRTDQGWRVAHAHVSRAAEPAGHEAAVATHSAATPDGPGPTSTSPATGTTSSRHHRRTGARSS